MRKRQRQNKQIQCSNVNICITYVSLCFFFWSVVRAHPQFSNIIHIISIYIIPLKSESLINIFFLSGRQRTITRTCARRKRSTFQLPLEINNNIIFISQLITETTLSFQLPWYIQYLLRYFWNLFVLWFAALFGSLNAQGIHLMLNISKLYMKTMYIQAHIYESCQVQPGFLYHYQDPGYIHNKK